MLPRDWPATMELTEPTKKVILTPGGPDIHTIANRCSSPKGQLVFPNKRLGCGPRGRAVYHLLRGPDAALSVPVQLAR